MSQTHVEHTQYKRVKLLGEGSYGKAYLVKNLSDDSLCVIKQLDISNMSDKEKKDTYNEAKVLKSLNHPSIVHFREVYKTKRGKLCIVMDYADGGDLAAKIQAQNGKHFTEAQILDWFTQICLGLKHVHDRKILHRDLKSQNIFLTKTNLVKLGDFGIAKVLSGTQELAMTVIGTPYYLSPELIDGKPYNFKSDIWALGVLLYELCTLHHPFDANGFPMLARKIVKGRYTPLPATFSKDLKDLVHSLLSVNPQDRPSINAILKKDVIQNRIKNFLDETIRAEEFSHTILHHKVIKLDHVHFEKKANHSKQAAAHQKIIFTVTKTKDQQIIAETQENNNSSKTPPSDSPIVRPVIHHRKPVAHLPLVFGNVPSHVPANQIRSPTANPIRSPVVNPGHLKPSSASRSKDHKSPRSHMMPEMENKLRPNPELPPLVTNSILTTKESPNLNSQISLSYVGISHHSPDLHLPNLNKQRFVPQPKSAQSKENRGHFEINKPRRIHLEDNTPSSKVGLKREALKGFDNEKRKSHLELLPKKLDFGFIDMTPSHHDDNSTKHSDVPKRNEKELKDIQAMVSELNKVIMNLDHQHQVDIVDHFDLKHETEKDVERDDDPEEPHHEIDEIPPPPVKLQKENSYMVDRKSLEELRQKLSQNLNDEKFFKAYTLAKDMVEKDQDMLLMEESVEYHMKMFPFLTREEVSNSLFDVFTFVVMEDWFRTKNLQ